MTRTVRLLPLLFLTFAMPLQAQEQESDDHIQLGGIELTLGMLQEEALQKLSSVYDLNYRNPSAGHFRMVKLDETVATAANKAVEERLVLLMEEELHPLRKKAAYEDAAAKVRKPALRHRQRIESVAVPCHAFHLIQIDRSRG